MWVTFIELFQIVAGHENHLNAPFLLTGKAYSTVHKNSLQDSGSALATGGPDASSAGSSSAPPELSLDMPSPNHSLLTAYRVFGPVDVKNIRREDLLMWLGGVMALVVLLMRYGVPAASGLLDTRFGFDLTPYHDLIMSNYVFVAGMMVGTVIGFLLLDERDENTLTALLVTPLPIGAYLAYRFTLPVLLAFVITCVTYPLIGLAPISAVDLIVVAGLASFGGPFAALFLAVFAENKITGLALTKVWQACALV